MSTAVWAFDAIGTRWEVDAPVPLPERLRARIAGIVDACDRAFSRFRPDSLVRRQAVAGGTLEYPEAAGPLLALYERVGRATAGRVTPLVGACLERLGYGADHRLEPAARRSRRRAAARGSTVSVDEPALLDVGAAGKGQLVDLVADAIAGAGIRGASTGLPVRDVVATWALTGDAMSADLLATALFFTPGERLEESFDLDWVRVLADGRAERSAALPWEVFA